MTLELDVGDGVPSPTPLSRLSFAVWLVQRREQIVGRAGHVYNCPLARFLAETNSARSRVYQTRYTLPGIDLPIPMPEWAIAFTKRLDEKFGKQADCYSRPAADVTGADCLTILMQIPE